MNVHVVAPDHEPVERVMGAQIGKFVRGLHESRDVVFHLGETITLVKDRKAVLKSGKALDVDFLVPGVGVKPSTKLAEDAGLKVDNGVLVNEYLESNERGIFTVSNIANWRDGYSGERLRIEHWVVAERQGQVAAKNMLGMRERYNLAPFFWTAQLLEHQDWSPGAQRKACLPEIARLKVLGCHEVRSILRARHTHSPLAQRPLANEWRAVGRRRAGETMRSTPLSNFVRWV